MKKLFVMLLLLLPASTFAQAQTSVVEIDVQGMTCPLCVDGLHSKLNELAGVHQAKVSLKQSRARIEFEPGEKPDLAAIRQAILDAGFTPGELRSDS